MYEGGMWHCLWASFKVSVVVLVTMSSESLLTAGLSAIDIATQRCGQCKSILTPLFAERAASQFQIYMKDNMRKVMEDLPGSSRADVMKEIGRRWTQEKEADATIIEVLDSD
jgi:hypothetical protein